MFKLKSLSVTGPFSRVQGKEKKNQVQFLSGCSCLLSGPFNSCSWGKCNLYQTSLQTLMCRARVLERCCSMCGLYNRSAFTMHALSLSDGLFPCISLMRVMHRGLAMHPSNHLEMWNHVNPYKGRFNTLENMSWELVCVLPQSMSGVQWTVAWSLWSVNRESSIFRAWQSRTRADWRNTLLWADISIMEAVCVISANRLGVVRGEGSTVRARAPGVAAIVILRCIEQYSLILFSADLSQVFGFSFSARKQTITVPIELH